MPWLREAGFAELGKSAARKRMSSRAGRPGATCCKKVRVTGNIGRTTAQFQFAAQLPMRLGSSVRALCRRVARAFPGVPCKISTIGPTIRRRPRIGAANSSSACAASLAACELARNSNPRLGPFAGTRSHRSISRGAGRENGTIWISTRQRPRSDLSLAAPLPTAASAERQSGSRSGRSYAPSTPWTALVN